MNFTKFWGTIILKNNFGKLLLNLWYLHARPTRKRLVSRKPSCKKPFTLPRIVFNIHIFLRTFKKNNEWLLSQCTLENYKNKTTPSHEFRKWKCTFSEYFPNNFQKSHGLRKKSCYKIECLIKYWILNARRKDIVTKSMIEINLI